MKLLVCLLSLLPALAGAQSISRTVKDPEALLFSAAFNATAVVANVQGGTVLPATRGFTVTGITMHTTSNASGAGAVAIRVTDGTNNCDVTWDCETELNVTGPKRKIPTGACSFPPGAAIYFNMGTASCVTTKPTVKNIQAVGTWR